MDIASAPATLNSFSNTTKSVTVTSDSPLANVITTPSPETSLLPC